MQWELHICRDVKIAINQHLEIQQYAIPHDKNICLVYLHGEDKFSKIDLSEAYQ